MCVIDTMRGQNENLNLCESTYLPAYVYRILLRYGRHKNIIQIIPYNKCHTTSGVQRRVRIKIMIIRVLIGDRFLSRNGCDLHYTAIDILNIKYYICACVKIKEK